MSSGDYADKVNSNVLLYRARVYQSYRYSVFGEITFGAPQYENEYTYNGENYNPNIESQYLRARYYCVVTATFLTEDSYLGNITEPLTLNRYLYCVASPVNYVDPSGNEVSKEEYEEIQEYYNGLTYGQRAQRNITSWMQMGHFIYLLDKIGSEDANVEYVISFDYTRKSYLGEVSRQTYILKHFSDCEQLDEKDIQEQCYALNGTFREPLSDEQKKTNAKYIYDYLVKEGWTIQAISGLFGNIEQESGFNPGVWQSQDNSKQGYGLVQWTPEDEKLFSWIQENKDIEMLVLEDADSKKYVGIDVVNNMAENNDKQLMDYELEYLIWSCQLSTSVDKREWFATTNYDSPYKMSYSEYIESEYAADELALVFHASYERSADDKARKEKRMKYALEWYEYLLGIENEE